MNIDVIQSIAIQFFWSIVKIFQLDAIRSLKDFYF